MSENRDLADPTREERVSCLSELAAWIDREGGTARGIRVIKALADHDLKALTSGQEPRPCEPATICSYLVDDGDRLTKGYDPGDIVRNSKPEQALGNRLQRIRTALCSGGKLWQPELVRVLGGGRANPSLYRLVLRPMEPESLTIANDCPPANGEELLVYESKPARVSWLFRILFPPQGFEVSFRSARALAYLGLIILLGAFLALLGLLTVLLIGKAHPLGAGDYLRLAMFSLAAFWTWGFLRALTQVVTKRLVECPTLLLANDEFYGQIRSIRRTDAKVPTGWIAIVRISSQCPLCGGAVELANGKPEFSGRMIGRCTDAPSEHVYSFDPTSHLGLSLRTAHYQPKVA